MKRFCVVLVCVVFCLPLLLIPAFADNVLESDSSSLRSLSGSSVECEFVLNHDGYYFHTLVVDDITLIDATYEEGISSYTLSLSVGPHNISGSIWRSSTLSRYAGFNFSDSVFSSSSDFPTYLPFSDPLVIDCFTSSFSHTYYFSISPEGSVPLTINAPGVFPSDAYLMSVILNGVEVFSYTEQDAIRSVTLYVMPGTSYTFVGTFYNQSLYYMTLSYDGHWVSNNSASPTVFPYSDSYSLSFVGYNTLQTNYFTIESPPFTNFIGSGVGVVIDSFGDVIDYLVNTPSVAVFVALSVSCALIPLGIVAVKKVIKGY